MCEKLRDKKCYFGLNLTHLDNSAVKPTSELTLTFKLFGALKLMSLNFGYEKSKNQFINFEVGEGQSWPISQLFTSKVNFFHTL